MNLLTIAPELDQVKIKFLKQEFKTMKLTITDINLINDYCAILKYKYSINKSGKTIKVTNERLNLWGYIQKLNGVFYYGYFDKDSQGNSYFVKKYPLTDNFNNFQLIYKTNLCGLISPNMLRSISTNQFNFISCGIIDIGMA